MSDDFHDVGVEDGKIYNVYKQDIAPVLERNKKLREQNAFRKPGQDSEHLASIPMVIYTKWMKEYGLKYPPTAACRKKIIELVRLPENKFLRTTERAI